MYDCSKILFLIVGTGNTKETGYPEPYLKLLRQAIESTNAQTVVLIPSGKSLSNAETIKAEYAGARDVQIENLPSVSMEFDADLCYEFFEKVFRKFFKSGYKPEGFTIDFTHGTKAMSAALYAIGMRYRVSDFHYIKRNNDKEGNLVEGQTVRTFDASYARALALLDQCKVLFRAWQFAAAKSLLATERPKSKELKARFERVQFLADFYAAWDRLDYVAAAQIFPQCQIDGFEKFIPPASVKEELEMLARPVAQTDDENELPEERIRKNGELLCELLIDLYANAHRRIESGLLEDGGIRIYRIAEMLGQACLFRKGYVSEQMPARDDKVKFFAQNNGISPKKCGDLYLFGREKAAEFLLKKATSEDDAEHGVAAFLVEKNEEIRAMRNTSILIHGFSSKAGAAEKMKRLADDLLKQINYLYGVDNVANKLKASLFMNKFKDND